MEKTFGQTFGRHPEVRGAFAPSLEGCGRTVSFEARFARTSG
jgi:hypothetical protein